MHRRHRAHRGEIARSAPARLIEEIYKILRAGAAEKAFRQLGGRWTARADRAGAAEATRASACGSRSPRSTPTASGFERAPDSLTNAILLGTLLVPLGFTGRRPGAQTTIVRPRIETRRSAGAASATSEAIRRLALGMLPLARRDVERLRQILGLQRRLRDMGADAARKRALMHRGAVPRGADVARDSRPRAGDRRALARLHRSHAARRAQAADETRDRTRSRPPMPTAAAPAPPP